MQNLSHEIIMSSTYLEKYPDKHESHISLFKVPLQVLQCSKVHFVQTVLFLASIGK